MFLFFIFIVSFFSEPTQACRGRVLGGLGGHLLVHPGRAYPGLFLVRRVVTERRPVQSSDEYTIVSLSGIWRAGRLLLCPDLPTQARLFSVAVSRDLDGNAGR